MNDFKHALAGLRKSPPLVAIAVVSLGLGIGPNVTVFSVAREMIFDDMSARSPERLARVDGLDASYDLYRELRAAAPLEDLAFYRGLRDQVWNAGRHNEVAWTLATSANFFDALGVKAGQGRLYGQADEGRDLAVLSYGFRARRMNAKTDALEESIQLNGKLYRVVGVLPRDYCSIYGHGVSPEVYLTATGDGFQGLFGRRKDGFSLDQTRQAMRAALERTGANAATVRKVEVAPMSGFWANAGKGGDERSFFVFFLMLLATAGMLMLIGCANVAGLLTARALNRRKEFAIRKALGASRMQQVRPLLVEGLLLAIGGAGVGLGIDAFQRSWLRTIRWPSAYGLPFEFHFQSDRTLLLYALPAAAVALAISTLAPALGSGDAQVSLAMKQGEPAFSARRWNLRSTFVALQVALATVLLTLGVLFARSLGQLSAAGPGFDAEHTLVAAVHTPPGASVSGKSAWSPSDADAAWNLRERARRRITATAGVLSTTSAGALPLMGELPEAMGRRVGATESEARKVYAIGAGEDYFATLRIPILRGRDFRMTDRDETPRPVVVNQTMAREFFADGDPVGQYLETGPGRGERMRVVGVAADAKMRTLGEADAPALFRPEFNGQFLVRVAGKAGDFIGPLQQALNGLTGAGAVDVRPLSEANAGALFPLKAAAGFATWMSALGVGLALLGLYGSVSYAVGRRTREFGIRAALGAGRWRLIATALRDGVMVLACGVALGAGPALLSIRLLGDLVPTQVNAWAWGPLAGVAMAVLATGCAASWFPARRAARTQPAMALRED